MSDDPTDWTQAFARLNAFSAPCPGFRFGAWSDIHASTKAFLAEHADRAHALGWTGLDLFGVHGKVGATRVDCCGALMVSTGALVTEVARGIITFSSGRYYKLRMAEQVLVWNWGKG